MAGVRINFAEVESSFAPMPEGTYDVIVELVEVRESKSSDNDYLNWEFTVQDDEFQGRKLWMITSLSAKALWKLKDTFLALEVIEEDDEVEVEWEDDVDITPGEGPRVTFPELDGLACKVEVRNEVYEGRERNKVQDVLGAGGAPAKATKSSGRPSKSANGAGRTRKLR
jgi:hypothetical protein